MTIYTIGYEGLDIPAFLSLLAEHDIETLVDVRELPLSRKRGFSKKALAAELGCAGYEYIHMARLGCPKPVRDRYREDRNWERYTAAFLKHLQMQGAALSELSELAATSRCALLCYEADYNFCHRSIVAAAVRGNCGASVEHIRASDSRTTIPADPRLAFA